VQRSDLVSAVVALTGVLLLGPLNGLLVAIAQSLLGLVYRSVQVHLDSMGRVPGEKAAWGSQTGHPERLAPEGILVLRLSGPLFWPNAEHVHDRLLRAALDQPITAMVLDLEATNQLDTTSADVLFRLLKALRGDGIDLFLVRVFRSTREVLQRNGFVDELGPDHMWHSIAAGVKAAKETPTWAESGGESDSDDDAAERIAVEEGDTADDRSGPMPPTGSDLPPIPSPAPPGDNQSSDKQKAGKHH
jgi:anti-anti-sigma factor